MGCLMCVGRVSKFSNANFCGKAPIADVFCVLSAGADLVHKEKLYNKEKLCILYNSYGIYESVKLFLFKRGKNYIE